MKTRLATAVVALALSVLCVTSSQASILFADAGDTIRLHDGPGSRGGVFYVDVRGTGNSSTLDTYNTVFNGSSTYYDFPTFCVEIDETISFNKDYYVAAISDTTAKTGYKLGSFAAWLYTEYLAPYLGPGTGLTGIIGTVTSAQEANAIQRGIWLSMGYSETKADKNLVGGYDPDVFKALVAAYQTSSWVGSATANVGNTWNWGYETGQVAVMNLTNGMTGYKQKNYQDQLVIDTELPPPTGNSPVPEPLSVLVWSMLAICVGTIGARRER
jgi:hypothetical protein